MKGFLPVDEFMRQKKIPIKQNKLTPNFKKLDKPNEDAYTSNSISGASKVESNKTLPKSPCKIQFHPTQMESKESSGHNNKNDNANTIKIVNTDANADTNKIDDTDANNANNNNNNDGVTAYSKNLVMCHFEKNKKNKKTGSFQQIVETVCSKQYGSRIVHSR